MIGGTPGAKDVNDSAAHTEARAGARKQFEAAAADQIDAGKEEGDAKGRSQQMAALVDERARYIEQQREIVADQGVGGKETDEWRELESKVRGVNAAMRQLKTEAEKVHPGMRMLASSFTNILDRALNAGFQNGFKAFWKSIADGFIQMVEQMIAKWIVFQVITGIFGGGALGGGGFFKFLGFDDGANDLKAKRWGLDFGNLFATGIADSNRTRGMGAALAGASGGVGGQTFHQTVRIDNVNMGSNMDIANLADRLAWHTQQQLKVRVGTR